jgi:hypothetical protein
VQYATLGGGDSNHTWAGYSVIVGGQLDTIGKGAFYSFLGGGQKNSAFSPWTVLGGGGQNHMDNTCYLSVISGGWGNTIAANMTGEYVSPMYGIDEIVFFDSGSDVIAGGANNIILGSQATIGGGLDNLIFLNGINSTVSGGQFNWNFSPASSIGGGFTNHIDSNGVGSTIAGGEGNTIAPGVEDATIPGGVGLIAQSLSQFVAGRFNKPQGSSTASTINGDDFLAIFGNGTTFTQSNAVTFSNNGHSTVYQTLNPIVGIQPTSWPSVGSTYTENTIVAEADVPAGNSSTPPAMSIGVDSIKETTLTSGVYVVYVHTKNPTTGLRDTLSKAVITVTLVDNTSDLAAGFCGYATCSEIGHPAANEFIVRTYSGSGSGCTPTYTQGFFFHLTGKE